MKRAKQVLSVLLAVVMLVALVSFNSVTLGAESITKQELQSRYSRVKNGTYGVGRYFRNDQSKACCFSNGTSCHGNHSSSAFTNDSYCNCKVATSDIAGVTGGIQCFGYARYVLYQLFGLSVSTSYTDRYKLTSTTNVSLVGQTDSNSTAKAKDILSKAYLGDFIQSAHGSDGMHSMIVESVSDSGVTVLECNYDGNCHINTRTISFSSFASKYNKFSVYRATNHPGAVSPELNTAPTYATISTDRYSYAVDERVYFSMTSDGTVNNLWIYCPNGQTLTYKDVGTEYDLGFGMSGEYEALVQTWNGIGSYTSERIHFLVGNPTRAVLSTDHTSYAVDEIATFTCDTNGSPNCNVIWIYCPNGQSLHYSDIGTEMKLGFGMKGEYEALVQAWSRTGSYTSDKIKFVIGPPTRARISANKSVYSINEEITLTCDTNGSENSNTLWIYCPDGTSQSYTKVGTSYKLRLNQAGRYEALVQAWNRVGSLSSEKISFEILTNHTHSYTSSITKAATCSAAGVETFTCSCGDSYTKPIAINPNNHVNTKNVAATASTCTVKGYSAGVYCNDCKQYISGHVEQPLAAHQTTVINAREATYDANGYTGDTYCTVCKQTLSYGASIPKLTKPNEPTNPTNPTQPATQQQQQQSGNCKYCGGTHSGFPGILIGFFHSILALFGLRKR